MQQSALVLFSGGQDSTTCLAWSLARYERVETIAFDYSQRHRVELIVAETHTCYLGQRGALHAWGYGCRSCPACQLRRRGYEAWSGAFK